MLGLLLLRRRLLKLDESERTATDAVLLVDCPRRQERYELRVAPPPAERVAQIEQRLYELLNGSQESSRSAA